MSRFVCCFFISMMFAQWNVAYSSQDVPLSNDQEVGQASEVAGASSVDISNPIVATQVEATPADNNSTVSSTQNLPVSSLKETDLSDVMADQKQSDLDAVRCMEFEFGCATDKDPIIIYVLPSCVHCGVFLVENLQKFLEEYGQIYGVRVRFMVDSIKDLFILKLFNMRFKENKHDLYWKYTDYMKRVIATINNVEITDEQKENYNVSKKDPDFIKFQVIAHDFGFTDKEILDACPDSNEKFEKTARIISSDYSDHILEITDLPKVEMPFIERGSVRIENLPSGS